MSTLDDALRALFQMAHKELLWQNASPTSNFPAQTIAINDVSAYDFFAIESYWSASRLNQSITFLYKEPSGAVEKMQHVYNFSSANMMGMVMRNAAIVSAGIEFEQCLTKSMTSSAAPTSAYASAWQIPYRIYGYKLSGGRQ